MKHFFTAAISAAVILGASAAGAATFSGDTSGFFRSPTNADDDVRRGNYGGFGANTALQWGTTGGSSILGIRDWDFDCDLGPGLTHCKVGQIDYRNASSAASTNDEDFNVNARLEIDVDSPIVAQDQRDGISLNLRSTLNQNSNTQNQNADFILAGNWDQYHFDDDSFGVDFSDLGGGYTLLGFELSLVGAGSLTFPSAREFVWTNTEDDVSRLIITAKIEGPTPVPLPAAGWLLLASVGGLAAAKRRAKKKA